MIGVAVILGKNLGPDSVTPTYTATQDDQEEEFRESETDATVERVLEMKQADDRVVSRKLPSALQALKDSK